MTNIKLLCIVFLFCLAGCRATGPGAVTGKVIFDEEKIPARIDHSHNIKNHHDGPICSCGTTLSERLIIDPATKGIQNAVVYIEKMENGKALEVSAQPVVYAQKCCRFDPHVFVVPAGATVQFKNEDATLHNFRSYSKNRPFNEGVPKGQSFQYSFPHAEIMKIGCDVHPWSTGWLFVTDTPYYCVSHEDGSFEIPELPAGKYTLKIWHEVLGSFQEEVVVKNGSISKVDVKLARRGEGELPHSY